jgi:hypothetical protein
MILQLINEEREEKLWRLFLEKERRPRMNRDTKKPRKRHWGETTTLQGGLPDAVRYPDSMRTAQAQSREPK